MGKSVVWAHPNIRLSLAAMKPNLDAHLSAQSNTFSAVGNIYNFLAEKALRPIPLLIKPRWQKGLNVLAREVLTLASTSLPAMYPTSAVSLFKKRTPMKLARLCLILAASLSVSAAHALPVVSQVGNLVNNGNFESGALTGVVSGYAQSFASALTDWSQWGNTSNTTVTTSWASSPLIEGDHVAHITGNL
jgi:hypothetical protein